MIDPKKYCTASEIAEAIGEPRTLTGDSQMYVVKNIGQPEIVQFEGRLDDELVTEGFGVFELDGDKETLVGWFADKYAAEQDADERNEND